MGIASRRVRKTWQHQSLLKEYFNYPSEVWPESSLQADGRYAVIHDGGGIVQITSTKQLQLESSATPLADGWGDTASSLVVSTNTVDDFDETVRLITRAQLRNEAIPAGSRGAPNPWEVAWWGWHFSRIGSDNAFYYVILKPTGFELGKVDQTLRDTNGNFILPGGQRFMFTDSNSYPINVWYTLRVKQIGAAIDIWVDGAHIVSFLDGPGSTNWNNAETILTSGAWMYYHEDARVQFDDGPYIPMA